MLLQISRVSDELTSNGNKIVTLKAEASGVINLGGGLMKSRSLTYFMAVDGNSTPEVGTSVDLDLDLFEVKERPYEVDGKTLMLKWLHFK